MSVEAVGGVLAPPTAVAEGRRARLLRLAPFLPAAIILVGFFFAPLALMVVFSFWQTNERLDIVHDLEPRELRELLQQSRVRPNAGQDDRHRHPRHGDLPGHGFRDRVLPRSLRLAALGAFRPDRDHRAVLDELPAAGLFMAGDPRRARRAEPGPDGHRPDLEPSFLLVYNDAGTFLVLVYLYIPFATLALYAALDRFDFTQLTAAQDLGARPDQAFRRILLPQIRPGVITACIFVFIPILGEFLTPRWSAARRDC